MADYTGNRTEQATPRRKADARRKGQIALSRDVPTAAVLFGAIGLLFLLSGTAVTKLTAMMQAWLSRAADPASRAEVTAEALRHLLQSFAWDALGLSLPFAGGIAVIGCAGYLLQTGWLWQTESLRVDPSRVSPIAGLTRLVSFRSVAELVKALVKVAIIGIAAYLAISRDLHRLPEFIQYDLPTTLHMTAALVFRLSLLIATTVGLIAVAD